MELTILPGDVAFDALLIKALAGLELQQAT